MKKTILLLAALGLLGACAGGPGATRGLPICENVNIPPNCENASGSGPKDPKVNFNKNGEHVAPPNVCTNPKVLLKFKITPSAENQNPPGSVMIIPKKGGNPWLTGINSPDNTEIEIEVPDLPIGTSYDYTIVYLKDGVLKCIDPRVSVE